MKIGILTFHHGYNFGGFLQVFALQSYLQKNGYDVSVINYINPTHRLRKIINILHPKRALNLPYEFQKTQVFHKIHSDKLKLTTKLSNCSDISEMNFDTVILGSDEIWNFNNMMFGFDRCYFGGGFSAKRKIAYAASFGPRQLNEKKPESLVKDLKALDSISVRDRNSQKFLKQLTGTDVPIVADPTFLVNFTNETHKLKTNRNYALVYGVSFEKQALASMRQEAKKRDLELISIGYRVPQTDRFVYDVS
ncbi:polysaccharide pyruvyl transferase family protein, partial [Thermodesulfobacteriota bacterium]